MEIIIRGKTRFGRNRSEQEENLRREGMRSMSDEQLDACRHIEKKQKDKFGLKESFIGLDKIGGDGLNIKTEE